MPLVGSLNGQDDNTLVLKSKSSVNEIVSNITFDILKESPQLVAEVEAGLLDKKILETAIIKKIDEKNYFLGLGRDEVIRKVFDVMFGYWDLEPYIKDEDASDIDGLRYDYFTIRKNGVTQSIPLKFESEKQFDSFCKIVAIRNGGILNENDSHCRVADEKNRLRINVSIRPRNITGPAINIRKHREKSYTLDDLVRLGMLDARLKNFFKSVALSRVNILFCGKGAVGKTTLMRAVINNFSVTERVLICESDSELYPDNPNFIVQRIKKANEGGRSVTLLDLIKDGLTMSLDTYVIGEIVSKEASDLINAGFTGHRILASLHSLSGFGAFDRLLTLVKSANADLSEKTIRRMIAHSIDAVVYMDNFKVMEVIEVTGYDEAEDRINSNYIYRFDSKAKAWDSSIPGNRISYKLNNNKGVIDSWNTSAS